MAALWSRSRKRPHPQECQRSDNSFLYLYVRLDILLVLYLLLYYRKRRTAYRTCEVGVGPKRGQAFLQVWELFT